MRALRALAEAVEQAVRNSANINNNTGIGFTVNDSSYPLGLDWENVEG